jgi:GTP cyclohydrolase III
VLGLSLVGVLQIVDEVLEESGLLVAVGENRKKRSAVCLASEGSERARQKNETYEDELRTGAVVAFLVLSPPDMAR